MLGDLFNVVKFCILIEMDSITEYSFTNQWCAPRDAPLLFYSNLLLQIIHLKSQTFHLSLKVSLVQSFKYVIWLRTLILKDEFSWENVVKDRHAMGYKSGDIDGSPWYWSC